MSDVHPEWADPTHANLSQGGDANGRPRRRFAVMAAMAAAVLVVAGVVVWQPWKTPPPDAPTSVDGRAVSATSIRVSWVAPRHGSKVDRYLVLRGAALVGSVEAPSTWYVDGGLRPGTTYSYRVVSASGGAHSAPSTSASATSLAPSPGRLETSEVRATWAEVRWSAPPDSPPPDEYVFARDGRTVATLAGRVTSYVSRRLGAATTYRYQVAAVWGAAHSAFSAPLDVTTLAWDAPLQGFYAVQYQMTATPGRGASGQVGQTWDDDWAFVPNCAGVSCDVSAVGGFTPPLFGDVRLALTLTRSGSTYAGSTSVDITRCGPAPGAVVQNSVSLVLSGRGGDIWNGWSATMVISAPYTTDGTTYYCPAQSWTMRLEGTTGGRSSLPPTSPVSNLMSSLDGKRGWSA
jgi:hypothetical protein